MAIDREFFQAYRASTQPRDEYHRELILDIQRSEAYQNTKHPDHATACEIVRDFYEDLPGGHEPIDFVA